MCDELRRLPCGPPGAVVVMGFSAGGHLAGCAGTMWNKPEIYRSLKKKSAAFRPDGMVLGYPVVSSGEFAHRASFVNLLGDRYEELLETASLEKQVKKQSPPAFLWHTADDTSVPVEIPSLLEKALQAKKIPVETHIYPHGSHGQSLADGRSTPRRPCGCCPCPAPAGWSAATAGSSEISDRGDAAMKYFRVAPASDDGGGLPGGEPGKRPGLVPPGQGHGGGPALFPEMWSCGYAVERPDLEGAGHPPGRPVSPGLPGTWPRSWRWPLPSPTWSGRTPPPEHRHVFDRFGREALTYAKVHTCDFGDERKLGRGESFPVASWIPPPARSRWGP